MSLIIKTSNIKTDPDVLIDLGLCIYVCMHVKTINEEKNHEFE